MFTLLYQIYKLYWGKPEFNILILGIGNSGKTKLLNSLKKQRNNQHVDDSKIIPTTGLNLTVCESKQAKLRLWDLGGRKQIRKIWTHYYEQAHAVVFVVATKMFNSKMSEIYSCLEQLLKQPKLQGLPFCILLNTYESVQQGSKSQLRQIFANLLSARKYTILQYSSNFLELNANMLVWLEKELLLLRTRLLG